MHGKSSINFTALDLLPLILLTRIRRPRSDFPKVTELKSRLEHKSVSLFVFVVILGPCSDAGAGGCGGWEDFALLAKEMGTEKRVEMRPMMPAKTAFTSLPVSLRAAITTLVLEHGVVSFTVDGFCF